MSKIVQECVALVLACLALQEEKEDLCLFVNEADFHSILAKEPKLITAIKYPTGAELYFLGVRLKILGSKSAPCIYRRVL